jgi:hypothetical protein
MLSYILINFISSLDYFFLHFNQKFMNDFIDFSINLCSFFYKIFKNLFLNTLYYMVRFIFINFLEFINTSFANKIFFKFLSLQNVIRDVFIYYNTRIIKLRKRYSMYFRFGKFRNFKLIFYMTFFIILIYIWQNRNLYRYNFPIRYYFYYLLSFMFLSIFIHGFIHDWLLSEILALTISFFSILLTLK